MGFMCMSFSSRTVTSLALALLALPACQHAKRSTTDRGASGLTFALAIHGGAGTIDPSTPDQVLDRYRAALQAALTHGRDMLAGGAAALDTCEAVVRLLEDEELFNAGKGAVFNAASEHELDASIMDGATLRCGAVAGVRTVRHPISLARKVMSETRHVLLAGDGAEVFADQAGVERVDNAWFDTPARKQALERLQQREQRDKRGAQAVPTDRRLDYGTVGCVALDQAGHLAAATSTGGMTGKRWGRIGDSPLLGAGNYADGYAAISCTGTGEEFIRHAIARSVTARMQFGGQTLEAATHAEVFDVLKKGDGGLIAVDRSGKIAMPFNSTGMYRAAADSSGRFSVAIFGGDDEVGDGVQR